MSLTNDNYEQAIDLLKERYGNTQVVISAHMNDLLKMRKIESDRDIIGIRKLYDDIESHVRSLDSLGIRGENYGSLLTPIIMDRLPHEFKLNVSRNLKDELWDLTKFLTLIHDEIKARENCSSVNGKNDHSNFNSEKLPFTGASLFTKNQSSPQHQQSCVFCRKPHWSDKCTVLTDCESRKNFLKRGGRCFLCLKPNHKSKDCDKKKTCFYCKGFHNSAICAQRSTKPKLEKDDSPNEFTKTCHVKENIKSTILLQTAETIIENPVTSKQVKIKMLFDSGSQRTYISNRIKNFLNLKPESTEQVDVSTFGNPKTNSQSLDIVKINLHTQSSNITLQAISYPMICTPIKNQLVKFVKEKVENFRDLKFADEGSGDEIDMLIGSDYYWSLVTGRIVESGLSDGLVAIETKLGWVVSGPVVGSSDTSIISVNSSHVLSVNCEDSLNDQVKKFWDLETLGIRDIEKSCYEDFEETITRNEDNRYEINLPFKQNHPIIHDNFEQSKTRLKGLHEQLKRNPDLMKKYDEIFQGSKSTRQY